MAEPIRILGISGSLRAASYNRALLAAAAELLPPGVVLDTFDLHDIPPYDGDVEAAGDPPAVAALKEAIHEADALLIATPEYNRGIPGVLKNALDWASRPPYASPLTGKLAAVMGAATGRGGTVNAQRQVRETLSFPRGIVLEEPVVAFPLAFELFEDGRLTDEAAREQVRALVEALAAAAVETHAAAA